MRNEQITKTIQALDDFEFTAEEYCLNITETTNRAIEHIQRLSREQVGKEIILLVSEILRCKYRSMLEKKVEWIIVPIKNSSDISCRLEGSLFRGKALIAPKRISVCLDQEGLKRECVLHDWAPAIFTESPFDGSPATHEGQERAKELFLEICFEARLKFRIFASNPTQI